MTHNLPLPDEPGLEKLIKSVYERMPVAEISHLNRIEERLSRKLVLQQPVKTANKIPWWIVLIIISGFATAAWWAGEIYNYVITQHDVDKLNGMNTVIQHGKTPEDPVKQQENHSAKQEDNTTREKSPVIFQREF